MTNTELIQAIKTEIERHLNSATEHQNANPDMPKYRWYLYEGEKELCTDLLGYIDDSLESEKPMQEGLEQEINKCWQEWVSPSNKPNIEGVLPLSEFAFYARHFALWQKEQMMKEGLNAVKSGQSNKIEKTIAGVFVKYGMDKQKEIMMKGAVEKTVVQITRKRTPVVILTLDANEYKDGDKVKVIICKRED